MPTSRTHQNSFTRGEVDETIIARTDIGSYQQALKKARNVFTLNQGAVERRAGTLYRADLGAQSRLEGFVFNETQEYILAFQNTALKIYSSNGTLLQTITSCPWTTSILFELNVTQQGDSMIVVHSSMTPQILKRTGATTFTRTDFAFKDSVNGEQRFQPYFKFADDTITLDINTSTAGSVTAITSADYFTSAYVGTIIRYHGSEILISGYTDATTVTGTLKKDVSIELDDDPFKTKQGSGVVKVTHVAHGFTTGASITIEGAEDIFNDDGNGLAQGNLNGAQTITVVDDNHYEFTAGSSDTANDSQDGGGVNVTIVGHPPTRSWDEQVYSTPNGFPKTAKFHQQRLFFGGGSSLPDFLAGSKTADFFNFDVGDAQDTDSIQINISSDRINEIRHIISGKNLEILTSTGEFYLKPQVGKPLTPVDLQIIRQSNLGCSLSPMPRIFDGAGLFVQNNGKNVREYFFNSAVEEYTPTLINTLSPQAISNPTDSAIVRSAGARTEQYILFVNDDGSIGVFTAHRQEKLAGWVLWTTDGIFESVAGITSFLYTAVKRTINGVTVYNLEQWANSPFAVPTDCTVSKTLSGSYQPHGSPAVNGAVSSSKQLIVDGFTNAPSVGESFQFAGTGTTFTIQSVNATGNTNEYILILDAVTSQSNNATLVFTTSKVFSGLNSTPSLIGKVVHATSGSTEEDAIFYYGSGTVSSGGVVQFQKVASSCDIGLDYTVDIETLPIDSMQTVRGLGSLYGFPKKIGKTVLELNKTYNLQLNEKDILLGNGIAPSTGMISFTGKKEIYALGYSTQPSVKITQSIPVPFRILSITSEVMY
tara:strand:- start:4445 stop:6910 length:2466 start_codon:yes stop_codon:yes gene_type:complete